MSGLGRLHSFAADFLNFFHLLSHKIRKHQFKVSFYLNVALIKVSFFSFYRKRRSVRDNTNVATGGNACNFKVVHHHNMTWIKEL